MLPNRPAVGAVVPVNGPLWKISWFSSDNGSTWNNIKTDISETSCEWNTIEVEDGNEYKTRIIATTTDDKTSESISYIAFTIENDDSSSPSSNIFILVFSLGIILIFRKNKSNRLE